MELKYRYEQCSCGISQSPVKTANKSRPEIVEQWLALGPTIEMKGCHARSEIAAFQESNHCCLKPCVYVYVCVCVCVRVCVFVDRAYMFPCFHTTHDIQETFHTIGKMTWCLTSWLITIEHYAVYSFVSARCKWCPLSRVAHRARCPTWRQACNRRTWPSPSCSIKHARFWLPLSHHYAVIPAEWVEFATILWPEAMVGVAHVAMLHQ